MRVVAGAAASEADLRPAKIDEAFDLLRVCTQFEHDMLFQNVNDFRRKHIPQLYETNAISFSFAANLSAVQQAPHQHLSFRPRQLTILERCYTRLDHHQITFHDAFVGRGDSYHHDLCHVLQLLRNLRDGWVCQVTKSKARS